VQRENKQISTIASINYDAFGNIVEGENPINLGYTGKYFDELTQLQWNINRWYDATTGQWISEDPIGFGGGDANLRRYVGNDVISRIDTTGLYENDINVSQCKNVRDRNRMIYELAGIQEGDIQSRSREQELQELSPQEIFIDMIRISNREEDQHFGKDSRMSKALLKNEVFRNKTESIKKDLQQGKPVTDGPNFSADPKTYTGNGGEADWTPYSVRDEQQFRRAVCDLGNFIKGFAGDSINELLLGKKQSDEEALSAYIGSFRYTWKVTVDNASKNKPVGQRKATIHYKVYNVAGRQSGAYDRLSNSSSGSFATKYQYYEMEETIDY
jgi:RHS repeat-associated protein